MNQDFIAFSVACEQFGKIVSFDTNAVERNDHIAWSNTDPLSSFLVIDLTNRKAVVAAGTADAEKFAFYRYFRRFEDDAERFEEFGVIDGHVRSAINPVKSSSVARETISGTSSAVMPL